MKMELNNCHIMVDGADADNQSLNVLVILQ